MGDSLVQVSTLGITAAFVVLATLAVSLRLWARTVKQSLLGVDDYIIFVSLVFCWGLLLITSIAGGIGGVGETKIDDMSAATLFSKVFWVEPFLVTPALVTVKVSILLFYKRIFSLPAFKMVCNIMIAIVSLWGLSNLIVQLTMAYPIYKAWDLTGNYIRIDYATFALASAGTSIGLDFLTLCLPLPVINRLQIKGKQKLMTIGIFWLGLFCVVSGAIRFYYGYIEIASAVASTGESRYSIASQVYLWDRIEPCASVIAACLPTYGTLIRGNRRIESWIKNAQSFFSSGTRSSQRSSANKGSNGTSSFNSDIPMSPRSGTMEKTGAFSGIRSTRDEEWSERQGFGRAGGRMGTNNVVVTSRFDLEYEDV